MGKVYYRHFAGTISGSPGSTSTISFDSALDASTDLKAIIIFAVDAKAQNDASYSVTSNGPMESYGFTDLTNEFCSDSSHRDEATGANLGDMSSSINSSLLHLYDESADSTFAECSYTSHTTSGFTVTWATQPTGTGTQLTYTGYAICGPSVEAEVRSDWISSTTAATVDTITFSSLTGLEAVNIISVPDMATLGSRRLENCGINRAWLNSNGDSNAVLEKHALESDGAIRTVQGGFDNGVVSGTSRTDAHFQWKRFYQVSGAISGNDLDLTIGGTNLTWGLRYMCLGLYLDGAATGQATNDTDTSTTFTPSPTVTNPGVIDGMNCATMNTTGNVDSAYSQAWTGTVFDESDTTVGAFGMGSSSSANLTTKQNIAARTTPQNLPNSSSLYYRTFESNSSEKHAYVSSVNNTTGEVTLAWTPSVDTVAGRHGVYFVLGQQAGGGGGAAQTVTATGIASGEAFGSPTLTPGAVTVTATGIASVEAFGTATVQAGAVTATATGIASSEAFGTPTATAGTVQVSPQGIASGEAFGTPSVSQGTGSAQSLSATGIASSEAFGSPEVQPGTATIAPPGIGSGVVFGVPNLLGQVGILPVQIFSAEAFGTPTLSGGAAQLLPSGIPTAEAFGTANVIAGTATVTPAGIFGEAFGTPALNASGPTPPPPPSIIDAGNSSVTTSDATGKVADGKDAALVTATVRDASNNPIQNAQVWISDASQVPFISPAFKPSGADTDGTYRSPDPVTTDANGVAAFYVYGLKAHTQQFTVEAGAFINQWNASVSPLQKPTEAEVGDKSFSWSATYTGDQTIDAAWLATYGSNTVNNVRFTGGTVTVASDAARFTNCTFNGANLPGRDYTVVCERNSDPSGGANSTFVSCTISGGYEAGIRMHRTSMYLTLVYLQRGHGIYITPNAAASAQSRIATCIVRSVGQGAPTGKSGIYMVDAYKLDVVGCSLQCPHPSSSGGPITFNQTAALYIAAVDDPVLDVYVYNGWIDGNVRLKDGGLGIGPEGIMLGDIFFSRNYAPGAPLLENDCSSIWSRANFWEDTGDLIQEADGGQGINTFPGIKEANVWPRVSIGTVSITWDSAYANLPVTLNGLVPPTKPPTTQPVVTLTDMSTAWFTTPSHSVAWRTEPESDDIYIPQIVHAVNYYQKQIGWNDGNSSGPNSYNPPLIVVPLVRRDGSPLDLLTGPGGPPNPTA